MPITAASVAAADVIMGVDDAGGRHSIISTPTLRPVVISALWGSLRFQDAEIERDWNNYSMGVCWELVGSVLNMVCKLFVVMSLAMGGTTFFLHVSLADQSGVLAPDDSAVRDDALRWTVALAAHALIGVCLYVGFRAAVATSPKSSVTKREASLGHVPEFSRLKAALMHKLLAAWFALWLGTLAYLNISTKFSHATAVVALAAADSTEETSAQLQAQARAANCSTALIALLSLSCFMRGLKLAYEQCALSAVLLLAATLVAWCLQPAEAPLDEQPAVMWTNLAWVVLATGVDVGMVRGSERVRRRLFHAQRAMQRSNTHLLRENQMLLQEGSTRPADGKDGEGDFLDLESPVQKVLGMLRLMHVDDSLLMWHGAVEQAIHKLSRAKLHDLFLPSAMRLNSSKGRAEVLAGTETEMVNHILYEAAHHNDQVRICPHLPTSAHICPHLPTSAHICPQLPTAAHICTHLHTSAHICASPDDCPDPISAPSPYLPSPSQSPHISPSIPISPQASHLDGLRSPSPRLATTTFRTTSLTRPTYHPTRAYRTACLLRSVGSRSFRR